MTDKLQISAELTTFNRFVDVCPLDIDPASIESRDPPEPDIACRFVESGEEVAFELVEVIDSDWASLMFGQSRETAALRNAYESAPGEMRSALLERFSNALIYVAFRALAAASQRKPAVEHILHGLLDLPPDYRGNWRPETGSDLSKTVRAITVSRGGFEGPVFDVEAASSIGDPTLERIRGKWAKSYETPRPIELLAFYELQPTTPESWWKPAIDSFLQSAWSSSPFRRVWLFDVGSKTILYRAERAA